MSTLATLFAQWFGFSMAQPPVPTPPVAADAPAPNRDYPPRERGLPAISVAEILSAQKDWLLRLRYAYGADQVTFDRDIGSVVERYAQYVHLLPATRDAYFRHVGGLFSMGLEIGFYALQASDGAIFPGRRTITERCALEPRWRYATFLAGLCSELHRTLDQLTVTNDRGEQWPAYLQPLALWLHDTKSRRYFLRWLPRPAETRALGMVAMSHVVVPPIMQYLAQANSPVLAQFMASASGTVLDGAANTLDQLVQRSAALVIEHDRRLDPGSEPATDPRFERGLVDAMRALIAQRRWVPNAERSCLWHGEDGLFLLWPQAAIDLAESLTAFPQTPEALAERLLTAGIVEARPDGSSSWDIFVADATRSASALKLAFAGLLLSATATANPPLPRRLLIPAAGATAQMQPPSPKLACTPSAPGDPDAGFKHPRARPPCAVAPSPPLPAALIAPARLHPAVRDALRQIIATLSPSTLPPAASAGAPGAFVPLHEFERRGVDPALAVRALSDAHMLSCDPCRPESLTCLRTSDAESVLGVLLARQYISGYDERAVGTAIEG